MVYKYEKAGKLPARVNGGWDLDEAKRHLANTLGAKKSGEPRRHAPAQKPEQPVARPAPAKHANPEDEDSRAELEKAVLRERAEKMRLENEKSRGVLVNASEVESATEARFRADSEALLSWPTAVSAEMAAELSIQERLLFPVLDRYVRAFMRERSHFGAAA